MNVAVKCPRCSQTFAAPENARGQRVACPRCGQAVTIPPPVMTRSQGSELSELIEDELKPTRPVRPVASPETQQTISALGIPQKSWLPWKTPPAEIAEGGAQEVWHSRPNSVALFLATHKQMLALVALSIVFFAMTSLSAKDPFWASVSGAGIVLALTGGLSEHRLFMFGACFSIAALLAAVGSWRSEQFQGVERRAAERWQTFELVFGVIFLATIAILVTWRIGVQFHFFATLIQDIGFHRKLLGPILGLVILWLLVIGLCAFVVFNAQKKGFFRMAGAGILASYFMIPLTGVIFYFGVTDFIDRGAPRGQFAVRPDRSWTRVPSPTLPPNSNSSNSGPVNQPRELTDLEKMEAARAARFAGPAMADDTAAPASSALARSFAEVRLGQDLDEARQRGFIKWSAQVDPAVAKAKLAVARQPAIALPQNCEVILPPAGGMFAAVRTNVAQQGSTFELWDLAQGRSVGKIPSDADLSTGLALSSDGKYLAGVAKGGAAIEIWKFGALEPAARIPIERGEKQTHLLFPDDKTILAVVPSRESVRLYVAAIADAALVREIPLPAAVKLDGNGFAVSPGGRYLAAGDKTKVWLIDLQAGRICGALAVAKNDATFFHNTAGMSFSPDGEELALLLSAGAGDSRLLSWHVADGTPAVDHSFKLGMSHRAEKSAPLLYFSDKQHWLVDGKAAVDRRTGRVWPVTQPNQERTSNDTICVKGFCNDDQLVVASDKMLSTWTVPNDVTGRLDVAQLKMSLSDLPEGMFDSRTSRQFEERFNPLEGAALRTASRDFRSGAMIDALSQPDEQFVEAIRWYPAAKQPVFGLRWGIGIQSPNLEPAGPSTAYDLSKFSGAIGAGTAQELNKRLDSGEFGPWPARGEARVRHVIPLGAGDRDTLLRAAAELGLDGVVIFELTDQMVGRNVDTALKARVSDTTGEPQWVSKSLNKARFTRENTAALVAQFLGEVFSHIDANYKLKPMPVVTADDAKARTELLAAITPADVFSALAEVRYFQVKKLISPELAATAYKKWLGDEVGKTFATGDARQRRAALQGWLNGANQPPAAAAPAN